MSSPAASDAGARPKKDEQITFRFCSECSNMLYPKEDEVNHKLMFECRTCAYTEEAASTCIFRHNLSNSAGETAGVTQDVGSDPTVGDPLPSGPTPSACVSCSLRVLCVHCGDVIRCHVCEDVLDQGFTDEEMFDWREEQDDEYYEHLDEYIDESSEESLVDSLTSAGMILHEGELLWYAGETSRQRELREAEEEHDDDDDDDEDMDHEEEDHDQPMEGCAALPICL